jgi:AcrR family transcriptional regulator
MSVVDGRTRTAKAQATARTILEAAERVLVEDGYHRFSVRRVAAAAGVTVGNLQYHFPTRDRLIEAMLDACIGRYLDFFDSLREGAGDRPRAQFEALVRGVFRDLGTRQTTLFFPELWSLANHEPRATELMDAMYARYRAVLEDVIGAMQPRLDGTEVRRLALFVSASLEGHTVFVGHGKPWRGEIEALADLAITAFVPLIEQAGSAA